MEKLDVFNELYQPLSPPVATIDRVHQEGLWHQTFACWLINEKEKSIFLQLRGPKNRIDPGSFDASAGGHLSSGEKPEDGFRELKEELGINIDKKISHYLGIYRNIAIRQEGQYINHEFCHVFLAKTNKTLNDLSLQAGEVDNVFMFNLKDAIDLFTKKKKNVSIHNQQESRNITIEDMCNYYERTIVSNYYLKIVLAAQAFLNGDKNVVI